MPKKDINTVFMRVAHEIAQLSYCERKKVGAILVKDKNIIAIGYNGTPSGFENCCEIDGVTRKETIHAELNVVLKCAKSTNSAEGATLYVTMSPCFECSKLIYQSGIRDVYYDEAYRDTEGLKFLQEMGVRTIMVSPEG